MKRIASNDRDYTAKLEQSLSALKNALSYGKNTGVSGSVSQLADSLNFIALALKSAGMNDAFRHVNSAVTSLRSNKKASDLEDNFFYSGDGLPGDIPVLGPQAIDDSFGQDFEEIFVQASKKSARSSMPAGTHNSVRELHKKQTDPGIRLPVAAGTKVSFTCPHIASVTYKNPPPFGDVGTVVSVKMGSGEATSHNNLVFVRWSDRRMTPVFSNHLAMVNTIRVASIDNLHNFFTRTADDQLIHKATQDIWSLKKDGQGFLLERLVDDSKSPVKI